MYSDDPAVLELCAILDLIDAALAMVPEPEEEAALLPWIEAIGDGLDLIEP